jgi:rhodanese-related sulfurtransferase
MNTITPVELACRLQSGEPIELLDVRTPAEFQSVHASIARNVPLSDLNPAAYLRNRANPQQTLYLICQSGARGRKACEAFQAAGFANLCNVDGGTAAWVAAGLPVVQGKKMISLERQVRIAAGSLVLIGTILAWLVHPYFIGLPAFIGAGLVFAGITDTCGMGIMLAQMPWNKVPTNCAVVQGATT